MKKKILLASVLVLSTFTSSVQASTKQLKKVSSILSFRRAAKIDSFKTKETVEIETRLRLEAEEKAKKEAEEKAKKEAEEKAKKEAEEKAKKEVEEKTKKEAEEKAKKEVEERAKKEAAEKAKKEAEERARKAAEQSQASSQSDDSEEVVSYPERSTEKLYDLQTFMFSGVINWQGLKFTYYSQSVLPGGGLQIPGRHVNKDGYVSDGDGYIVLAGSAPKGTVYDTPFGYQGKIYDRGTVGNHLDVYIR